MESLFKITAENLPFVIGLTVLIYILYKTLFSVKINNSRPTVDHGVVRFPQIPENEMKQLMDVYPTWHKENNLHPKRSKDVFPDSPVMPDLSVINGVAPYNPNMDNNEQAIYAAANQNTPAPAVIPVPTMFPSPKNIKIFPKERFRSVDEKDVYNGYVNQPMVIEGEFERPVDGIMSRWTQFSPCMNNEQERTRTCIHDEISGGKPCGHTLEKREC